MFFSPAHRLELPLDTSSLLSTCFFSCMPFRIALGPTKSPVHMFFSCRPWTHQVSCPHIFLSDMPFTIALGPTKSPVHMFFSLAYPLDWPLDTPSLLSTCFFFLHAVYNCPWTHQVSCPHVFFSCMPFAIALGHTRSPVHMFFFSCMPFRIALGHTRSPVHMFASLAYRSELLFGSQNLLSSCYRRFFRRGKAVAAWRWPFSIIQHCGLMLLSQSSVRFHGVELLVY